MPPFAVAARPPAASAPCHWANCPGGQDLCRSLICGPLIASNPYEYTYVHDKALDNTVVLPGRHLHRLPR